eukprot:1195459-Prorocentrum_minimum.AAC.3
MGCFTHIVHHRLVLQERLGVRETDARLGRELLDLNHVRLQNQINTQPPPFLSARHPEEQPLLHTHPPPIGPAPASSSGEVTRGGGQGSWPIFKGRRYDGSERRAVAVRHVGRASLAGDLGSTRTNQTQEAWVCSHDGPIRHRKAYGRARHRHCRIGRQDLIEPSYHSREDLILSPILYGRRMSASSPNGDRLH